MPPIFGFILFFLAAILVSVFAKKRGLSFWKYFLICLVSAPILVRLIAEVSGSGIAAGFGAFLIPAGLFIFMISTLDSKELAAQNGAHGEYKRCPFCAEPIKAAAIKCKHCGSDLGQPTKPRNLI